MQGLFNMSSDSRLFLNAPGNGRLPLYEAKMMWQFDHRFTTYEGATEQQLNVGILPSVTPEQKADPAYCVRPRYWVDEAEVLNSLAAANRRGTAKLWPMARFKPPNCSSVSGTVRRSGCLSYRRITNAHQRANCNLQRSCRGVEQATPHH